MIKLIVLLLVGVMWTPFATSLADSLCWFYTSATCTGLVYTIDRAAIVFFAWLLGMLLALTLVG